MKTVICGSRGITKYKHVLDAVRESGFQITEVVSGCARGADQLGELYAAEKLLPVKKFPADWAGLGSMAGIFRNRLMAEYADAVIAVWDGKSPGTRYMIAYSRLCNIPVFVWKVLNEK